MGNIPRIAPYAHINESSDEEELDQENCVPVVVQVNHLIQEYEEGLELVGKDDQAAADIFSRVLNHALVARAKSVTHNVNEPLYKLKHLYRACLKVVGDMLAGHPETTSQALEFWREAVMMEQNDVALWHKMGKVVKQVVTCFDLSNIEMLDPVLVDHIALSVGHTSLAWYAFESGLKINPNHIPMLEKFLECALVRDDLWVARTICARLLERLPNHNRAMQVAKCIERRLTLNVELGQKRGGDDSDQQTVLKARIKRQSVEGASCSGLEDRKLAERALNHLTWGSLADVVASLLSVRDSGDELMNETDAGPRGLGVVELWFPNTVKIRLLEKSDIKSHENIELQEHQQQQAVHLEPVSQAPAATPEAIETVEQTSQNASRPNQRPKRRLQRLKAAHDDAVQTETCNVMEMFQSAFGQDGWDLLRDALHNTYDKHSTGHDKTDVIMIDVTAEDLENSGEKADPAVKRFLNQVNGWSVLEVARKLLEDRIGANVELSGNEEIDSLLRIDSTICSWLEATPQCALKLAELHMDAILELARQSDRTVASKFSKDVQSHLECCEKKLAALHETFVECVMDISDAINPFTCQEDTLRYHWTQARLLWWKEEVQNATREFSECLQLISQRNGATVKLPNCRHETTITQESVQKKLGQLEVIRKLDRVEELLHESQHAEVLQMLEPLVIETTGEKGSGDFLLTGEQKFRAFRALEESGRLSGNYEVAILAQLRLLEVLLPVPTAVKTGDTAGRGGPINKTPKHLEEFVHTHPGKRRLVQVGWFLNFCEANFPSVDNLIGKFPKLATPANTQLLRVVLAKAMEHAEWCFWRFTFQGDDEKTKLRQRPLHESTGLVFCLQQLDPVLGLDIDKSQQTAGVVCDLLAMRNALTFHYRHQAGRCPALNVMVMRLSAFLENANEKETGFPVKNDMPDDSTDASDAIDACGEGLAHCLECIYGVKFGGKKHTAWGSKSQSHDIRKPIDAKEALHIWQYIAPYLERLEQIDSDQMESCYEILHQIAALIPAPASEFLTAFSIEKFISDEDDLDTESPLENMIKPTWLCKDYPERMNRVQNLENRKIYEKLYYWVNLSGARQSLDTESDGGILGEDGLELVEKQLRWFKVDLALNPDRHWTWEALAVSYKEAVNMLLEAAARDLLPGEWDHADDLQDRLDLFLRCQRRCFLMSRMLAVELQSDEEQSYAEEMLAEIMYLKLQQLPPFVYKPRKEGRLNDSQKALCTGAMLWWNRAQKVLESEWTFPLYLAKATWKLKGSDWQKHAIDLFAQSAHFGNMHENGLIEPLFKLHSARLKLLLQGFNDWQLLTKYMFDPVALTNSTIPQGSTDFETRMYKLVFDDCREGLEFCRGKVGNYHKVHYRLALAYYQKGNYEGANSHIRQLFVQGRKTFCMSMTKIDREVFAAGRKRGTQNKSRKGSSSPVSSGRSTPLELLAHSNWGAKPRSVSGVGLDESVRRFAGAVRKYLMLYFKVLFFLGDLDTLEAAAKVLRSGKLEGAQELRSETNSKTPYPCLHDMAPKALGVYLILLNKKLRAVFRSEWAITMNNRILDAIKKSPADVSPPSTPGGMQIDTNDVEMQLNEEDIVVPDEASVLLERMYNVFYERIAEGRPDGSWNNAVSVALAEVLPEECASGKVSTEVIITELKAYTRCFIAYLQQKGDLRGLELLAMSIRKKSFRFGMKMASSPMKILAVSVGHAAVSALKQKVDKLTAEETIGRKESTISEVLSRGASLGKSLDSQLTAIQRDELENLLRALYKHHASMIGKSVDGSELKGVRLGQLVRMCEEVSKAPFPHQTVSIVPQKAPSLGEAKPPGHAGESVGVKGRVVQSDGQATSKWIELSQPQGSQSVRPPVNLVQITERTAQVNSGEGEGGGKMLVDPRPQSQTVDEVLVQQPQAPQAPSDPQRVTEVGGTTPVAGDSVTVKDEPGVPKSSFADAFSQYMTIDLSLDDDDEPMQD